jgi:hypothetical protein
MNVVEKALSSARFNRMLLWFGIAIFAVGALLLVVKLVGGTNGEADQTLTPSKIKAPPKSVPLRNPQGGKIRTFEQLDPKIRSTVRTFIDSAVARHGQARSWPITTPNLRAGYTKKQWDTSDALPVVPYPVWDMHHVNFALDYATSDEILLDVGMSSNPKLHLRALTFMLGLAPVGKGAHKRWLVDYWMPRYTPPIPIN